jgi:hypothetical protein
MRYYIPVFMAALSEIRLAVHPASRRGERGERDTERTAIEQYCARLEIHDQRSESGAGRCRGTKDVSAGNIICRSDSDSKGRGCDSKLLADVCTGQSSDRGYRLRQPGNGCVEKARVILVEDLDCFRISGGVGVQ